MNKTKVEICLASVECISSEGSRQGRFTIEVMLKLSLKELVFLSGKEVQGNSRQKGQYMQKASHYQVIWHSQGIISCLTQSNIFGDKREQ